MFLIARPQSPPWVILGGSEKDMLLIEHFRAHFIGVIYPQNDC